MNLFVLDHDIDKCAQYHCDRHCVKMILEATQQICTAFHFHGIPAPYKQSHMNHPCNVFCRESKENFEWVISYAFALGKEYIYRYEKKSHKSFDVLAWCVKNKHLINFPNQKFTKFALAMPDQYKVEDPVQSYRNYYNGEKRHLFNWKQRQTPNWIS
jgi:hypothetical protein